MARNQKLKVFRTPTGFHDAYVAAPSQKAALAAWGSDADLFARGIAELVTDEALAREPLDHPGKVIKRLRGTKEEQLAALAVDPPRQASDDEAAEASEPPRKRTPRPRPRPRPKPKPKPRPSRLKLGAAEQALADILDRQERERAEIETRQRAIEQERRTLETAQDCERLTAERTVERERDAHAERLARWAGD